MKKSPDEIRLEKSLQHIDLKQQVIRAKKKELVEGLPHLYGWPWYAWAKAFFDSTNKVNLLTAGNQLSKSSTMIRKNIHWATNKKLWPTLWRTTPTQFWYCYPSKELAGIELETKWIPEFLPRHGYRSHADYGWHIEWEKKGVPTKITFGTGLPIYFKTYKQDPSILQASTVYSISCDEELPDHLFNEFMARLAACDGYFHSVFTATLGQEFWRRVMEGKGDMELLPDAFKQQISLLDCQVYANGKPSPWTQERIQKRIQSCTSQAEIDKRIHGRFVQTEGRKYPGYDPDINIIRAKEIPHEWNRYAAVDVGSGGEKNHPAAFLFVAVNPEKTLGYVYKGWRGDGHVTTSSDILDKYREVRAGDTMTLQMYDQQSKDFGTISERQGETFIKSEKNHEIGEDVINTLFKNRMLYLFDTPELLKLSSELVSLQKNTPKQKAKDDFCDALRYCVTKIPWDYETLNNKESVEPADKVIKTRQLTDAEYRAWEIDERRGAFKKGQAEGIKDKDWQDIDTECAFWNEIAGE